MWRAPVALLLAAATTAPASADAKGRSEREAMRKPAPGCLSSGDTTEAVTIHKVVAPGQAIVQARRAVPDADILRALLCRDRDDLVYRISALRKDGRLIRVTIDAPSGKVLGTQ